MIYIVIVSRYALSYSNFLLIYSLERGLEKMRMPTTNETYLEFVNKELVASVRTLFWKNVAMVLDKEIRAAIKGLDLC